MTGDRQRKWLFTLATLVILVAFAVAGTVWLGTRGTAKTDSAPSLGLVIPAFAPSSPAAAKDRYLTIAAEDPLNKSAWYDLGVIAQQAGDHATASADFQLALGIDPHFESAWFEYGLLRCQANDADGAIDAWRQAVRANPNDADAHWYLGLALTRRSVSARDHESADQLHRALQLDPTLAKTLATAPAC